MKEHFENEKQDVQNPINEIKQHYEDLFNSYRTQGYIGEKKSTRKLYVIEEPKGKSKLDKEKKIELEKILERINEIKKNYIENRNKEKTTGNSFR